MELRVYWGKCCWNCLNHFPQVGNFWFLIDRWIWNYKWSRCVWQIRCWPRVSPPKFLFLFLIFNFFWDIFCTALSSNIVLWQTKTPNWVVLAWGECLNAFTGLKFRTETCVTSFRVNYLPWPVYKHKLIWSNLV